MAEKVTAGPITSANGVREAVCIHTKKIFSSCKDKDCIEDLTFYPTATAQSVIDACLLYTSPSPRDTERSRMPSSA